MELAGGLPIVEPHLSVLSPNITPDKETGIGKWTDAQIVAAIRNGKRPDGSLIGPPMPVKDFYQKMSDRDVKAIVAYLRGVKPVKNKVARNSYSFPLPKNYGPAVGRVAGVPKRNKLKYGAYLAGPLGHCNYCHTPLDEKTMNVDVGAHLGAGGLAFVFPFGTVYSANITPDQATGLGKWSDAEIKAAITQGKSKDGSPLFPPMPIPYYAKINAPDLDAIVAYVRSLPPKPAVRKERMTPAGPPKQ
jgi:mono/diheme cytochrome c family protein